MGFQSPFEDSFLSHYKPLKGICWLATRFNPLSRIRSFLTRNFMDSSSVYVSFGFNPLSRIRSFLTRQKIETMPRGYEEEVSIPFRGFVPFSLIGEQEYIVLMVKFQSPFEDSFLSHRWLRFQSWFPSTCPLVSFFSHKRQVLSQDYIPSTFAWQAIHD